MFVLAVGVIGAVLLIAAWVFEAREAVRRHRSLIDLRFAFIYLVGVSVLAFYSWLIEDAVFVWLNTIILVAVVAEIWYSLHVKKVHRGK